MGNSRFYSALTALLFAAVCAYAGAALFDAREHISVLPSPAPAVGEAAETYGEKILILGFEPYFAAVYFGGESPEPGPCRVKFQGNEESERAELLRLFRGDSGRLLLLRLERENHGPIFCRAELIY